MAHVTADRVQETTTTTGTGSITLAGAVTNCLTFASRMSTGDTCWYAILDSTNSAWEVGLGTLTSSTVLARTTVLKSSNSDAAVSLSSGTKNIFITLAADRNVIMDDTGTVVLPDFGTSTPNPPSGSAVGLFSRQVANRKIPAYVGPSGLDAGLQPFMARNKVGYWNPQGNATTVPGVFGLTAFTAQGTATARNVATTNLATRMRRIGYPTAATAGLLGGARIAAAQFTAGSGSNDGSGFFMVERFVPSDPATVSGRREFAGMATSTAAPTNVEPSALTNCVGIAQLSTDATQWYWVNGGSTAQTATACGTSVGAPGTISTTAWELAIFCPNSTANTYYMQLTNLTTGYVITNTENGNSTVVPQSSSLLAWRHWTCNNATALATSVDICSLYFETDT